MPASTRTSTRPDWPDTEKYIRPPTGFSFWEKRRRGDSRVLWCLKAKERPKTVSVEMLAICDRNRTGGKQRRIRRLNGMARVTWMRNRISGFVWEIQTHPA